MTTVAENKKPHEVWIIGGVYSGCSDMEDHQVEVLSVDPKDPCSHFVEFSALTDLRKENEALIERNKVAVGTAKISIHEFRERIQKLEAALNESLTYTEYRPETGQIRTSDNEWKSFREIARAALKGDG